MLTTALQRQPGHCALPWQHHLPWHQPSRHPAALSPSLAGLQLPAKMPLGTCHSCEDCLPLKLAPAQKTQAFPEVSVTGNTKHRSSFPTEEQDIFPQSWAITIPSLAIPAGERGEIGSFPRVISAQTSCLSIFQAQQSWWHWGPAAGTAEAGVWQDSGGVGCLQSQPLCI